MGNSNKKAVEKGEKVKGKKNGKTKKGGKKGGKDNGSHLTEAVSATVTAVVTEAKQEVFVEPSFDRSQYEKAKSAVVDGNVSNLLAAIENMAVNMKDTDDSDNTLLHYAALYNNVTIAKYLIEKGAKNRKNGQGQTPLDLATTAAQQDGSFFDMKNLLQKLGTTPGYT